MRAHVILPAIISAAAVACGLAAPAQARDAAALYSEGRFIDAGALAGAAEDADGQALAAKAYAAAAVFAADAATARADADAARTHGEAAVALDPDHVEGRLYLSVAIWLDGRRRGGLDAYFRGLPQRGRALIESVVADHPEEPWGHALLGAWHLEVLRRGGDFGRRTLGASVMTGAESFNRAMELDPGDAAIPAQCAIAYLALDPDRYEEHARGAIARSLAVPPRDAFQAEMQDRARIALALLDAGDRAALDAQVTAWVIGPD